MSLTLPPITNGDGLAGLCGRARPALAALGDLGAALLGVLSAVETAGGAGGAELLDDPGFALDVLTAAGPGTDPALVGRVLDFLRSDTQTTPAKAPTDQARRAVTLAEAAESYEAGALSLLAVPTQANYLVWVRRLVAEHGSDHPDQITAGDLKDLLARWVTEARLHNARANRDGAAVEASGVTAYRHLWAYLVDKGWARGNVAQALRKPPPDEPNRRPFRPEEAALLRHLARSLGHRHGLLNETTLTVSERLGLRQIELRRLRLCDVDLDRDELRVWGKGNKYRIMPIPPVLHELLERYVESRRPDGIAPEVWARADEPFFRHRPTDEHPMGRPVGKGRVDYLFRQLRAAAPDMFTNGDLTHHCYRHALGTFVDGRYGRAVTKAVLGHKSRRTSTDHYVHVAPETVREAICAYETHLLAADPTHQQQTEVTGMGEGVSQ